MRGGKNAAIGEGGDSGGDMADGELMFCDGEEESVVFGSCTTGEHTTDIGVLGEEELVAEWFVSQGD